MAAPRNQTVFCKLMSYGGYQPHSESLLLNNLLGKCHVSCCYDLVLQMPRERDFAISCRGLLNSVDASVYLGCTMYQDLCRWP